jgi:hypothetical protein
MGCRFEPYLWSHLRIRGFRSDGSPLHVGDPLAEDFHCCHPFRASAGALNLRDAFPEVVPHRFRAPADWEIVRIRRSTGEELARRYAIFPGSTLRLFYASHEPL